MGTGRMLAICFAVTVWAWWGATWASGTVIAEGERLSLERCIEIAIANQPAIHQQHHTLDMNEAALGMARSDYYPQLDLTAGLRRYNRVSQFGDPYTPLSQYGYRWSENNLTLKQKLYDFGKRESVVAAARLQVDAARADRDNQIAATVNSVKTAYYQVLRSLRTREVAEEAVDQYRRQLDQARLFFEAGKKPRFDVTQGEVNLGNARIDLIGAENDLAYARVVLSAAMGYEGSASYEIEDRLVDAPFSIGEEEAVDYALKHRQDMKSLLAQKEAAQKAVETARKDYYPSLDASAGYDVSGSQAPLSQGWNAGVSLSWNLFKGMATSKGVEKALANQRIVEARVAGLRLTIRQEVRKGLLDMKKARETIVNAEIQVRQASENLELANLRYRTGLGTPLDVTNATVAYSNAKLTRIAAQYNQVIARANVEKAMGNR